MEKEKPQNQDNNKNSNDQKQKKDIPLFREEVMQHKKASYLGKAIIISPLSFTIWTLGIFAIAIVVGLFLFFGSYSKKQEVSGMLVPNKGLIQVYPGNLGIISKKFVKLGEKVTKGQLLYLISTEQHTMTEHGAGAQQINLLEKQLNVQKNKLGIFKKNLERYKSLLKKKVVSEIEYQEAYKNYLSAESELHAIEQRLIEAKKSEDYAIRSPSDGTISTLVAMIGDRVKHDKPLASIIPKGAELQGMLFVPTESIGFIRPGQKVLLKYDAFPYRNFGLYASTIIKIDKSVLFPKDLDVPLPSSPNQTPFQQQKPFYRVIVALKQAHVMVYGEPQPLRPGMTLQGSILGNKRKIWQWFLDPIFSLRGSLTSS